MSRKHFYVLVNQTDEVIGVVQSEMPDVMDFSIARKCYLIDLGFKLPIGMFRYRRGGSKSDQVVIVQTPQETSNSSIDFIKTTAAVTREAPAHLLRWQTSYAITSIRSTVGSNSIISIALIYTLLPDSTSTIFCDAKSENEFVQEISTLIQNSDSINGDEDYFTDMRKFNCPVNIDKSKFSVFWSAADWVIDMDTGTGAHKRRHAAADEETNNNVLYAPKFLSIQELLDKEKELITKTDGKK